MSISPCSLIKQQLGLIKTKADGTEVSVYKEAIDIDGDKKKETIDTNGDKKISCDEVWSFFFSHTDDLPEKNVKKVVASIAKQVRLYKSAKHVTLLGQLAVVNFKYVKDYKGVLIKASQSDFQGLRLAAMDAMKMFLMTEASYYKANPGEKPKTEAPFPAPKNPQMCLSIKSLPEGYIEATVAEVVEKRTGIKRRGITDGDTIKLNLDINNDGKPDVVRFKGINTTEFGKGPTLKSRLKKAESGAISAWKELEKLLARADYKVYVRPEGFDSYGRFISQVFVKSPAGEFINVEAFLANQGLGMVYFVQVTDPEAYSCYLMHQVEAQKAKRGLWSLPEFSDKSKPFIITSFHPNAVKDRGEEEPLYNEYFRIVSTSDQPFNLMNYRIHNKVSGVKIDLPYFIVPPGRTVKIAAGDIRTNADPNDPEKDLAISLLFEEPFWENEEEGGACLIIEDLDNNTVDSAAKYDYWRCE